MSTTDEGRVLHPVDSETRTCCGGIGAHTFDCDNPEAPPLEPVNLDPDPEPPAEIVRWQELVHREHIIDHGGNAELVMPMPRPAWADPDCDIIGANRGQSYYNSASVVIPVAYSSGGSQGSLFEPANMRVRAKLCGDGNHIIGLSRRSVIKGEWRWTEGVGLTPDEATALAHVLLAAADLIGER